MEEGGSGQLQGRRLLRSLSTMHRRGMELLQEEAVQPNLEASPSVLMLARTAQHQARGGGAGRPSRAARSAPPSGNLATARSRADKAAYETRRAISLDERLAMMPMERVISLGRGTSRASRGTSLASESVRELPNEGEDGDGLAGEEGDELDGSRFADTHAPLQPVPDDEPDPMPSGPSLVFTSSRNSNSDGGGPSREPSSLTLASHPSQQGTGSAGGSASWGGSSASIGGAGAADMSANSSSGGSGGPDGAGGGDGSSEQSPMQPTRSRISLMSLVGRRSRLNRVSHPSEDDEDGDEAVVECDCPSSPPGGPDGRSRSRVAAAAAAAVAAVELEDDGEVGQGVAKYRPNPWAPLPGPMGRLVPPNADQGGNLQLRTVDSLRVGGNMGS